MAKGFASTGDMEDKTITFSEIGRDLYAFKHADRHDVRLVDCGDGLQFAAIGVKPEFRLPLDSVYGFLTLKNGVPIGYVLSSSYFNSTEVAYNVSPPFRGAEAARLSQ